MGPAGIGGMLKMMLLTTRSVAAPFLAQTEVLFSSTLMGVPSMDISLLRRHGRTSIVEGNQNQQNANTVPSVMIKKSLIGKAVSRCKLIKMVMLEFLPLGT